MTSRLTRNVVSSLGAPRRVALTLLALAGCCTSGAALGQPAAALTLRWEAPAGCPQQAEVNERIQKIIGNTSSTSTVLQAEGTITRTDSARFHLRLVMRSGNLVGERNLDATSCENLSGAAAVSLALLMRTEEPLNEANIGGKQAFGTTGSTGQQAAPPPIEAAARKQPEKKPESTPAESDTPAEPIEQRPLAAVERRWRALAQLPLAVSSIGPLPKPSWGIAFNGGVSFESWRFLLGGTAWRRLGMEREQSPGYGAEIDRLTGTLKACHAFRRSAWEVAPCLLLSVQHISARGTGPDIASRSEQTTWLAVGAGAQGRLYLANWLSLLVGVDAQIETARPVIAIDGVGDLGQLGPAALTVTAGPEWIL